MTRHCERVGKNFLAQICFKRIAVARFLETFDRPFLDLADTFLRQVVFLADLFDGDPIFAIKAEIGIDDLRFAGAQVISARGGSRRAENLS